MSNFMGVCIFWIGLNRADLGCWRLTLINLVNTNQCEENLQECQKNLTSAVTIFSIFANL